MFIIGYYQLAFNGSDFSRKLAAHNRVLYALQIALMVWTDG